MSNGLLAPGLLSPGGMWPRSTGRGRCTPKVPGRSGAKAHGSQLTELMVIVSVSTPGNQPRPSSALSKVAGNPRVTWIWRHNQMCLLG